jgi:5,10-methylene-tetrahydrofolate dehydrogenase/methenyl tetrahydrofolate cyclohydrolase
MDHCLFIIQETCDEFFPKASIYLPSIGKVTIIMLLRNLLRLQHYIRPEAEVEAE